MQGNKVKRNDHRPQYEEGQRADGADDKGAKNQFGDILQLTKHNQPQKQKELSNKCPQGKTRSPKENDEQTIP